MFSKKKKYSYSAIMDWVATGAAAVRWPAVGEEEEKRKEREKKERRVGALASNSNVAPSTPTKFVCFNLVFDFHFYFILISVFLNS
jgi:hypothetical protein